MPVSHSLYDVSSQMNTKNHWYATVHFALYVNWLSRLNTNCNPLIKRIFFLLYTYIFLLYTYIFAQDIIRKSNKLKCTCMWSYLYKCCRILTSQDLIYRNLTESCAANSCDILVWWKPSESEKLDTQSDICSRTLWTATVS